MHKFKHTLPPLPDGRTRYVARQWLRDPNGPLIEKPPPRGVRTPNALIWGHDLKDFFWLQRIPGVDVLTVWTRSMIKEFGENYDESEFKHKDSTHYPRRRHPWPVLKVPAGYVDYSDRRPHYEYNIIDQGCERHHSHGYVPKLLSKEKAIDDTVDEEFDELVKSMLGVPNDGVFMRNDPNNLVRDSEGRAYTLLFTPQHRNGLRALANGRDLPPQFLRPYPFTMVQLDLVGMHVLTALDDDALAELGGPSLPKSILQSTPSANATSSGTSSGGPGPTSSGGSGGSGQTVSSDVDMDDATTKIEPAVPNTSPGSANDGSSDDVKMHDDSPKAESDVQEPVGAAMEAQKKEASTDHAGTKHCETLEPIPVEDLMAAEAISTSSLYSVEDLPKLAEDIPRDWFPDYLHVHDPQSVTFADRYTYGYRTKSHRKVTTVYKRMYPKLARDDTPPDVSNLKTTASQTPPNVGHLHLAQTNRFGVGNHSLVHRAPMTLPKPLSAHSRDGRVVVAAKSAFGVESARQLLQQEAKMYNLFPQHLSEDWCGYNFVTPIRHPVPVGPVVPKFYGYYVPVKIVDGREVMCNELDTEADSPLLLIEECGEPVKPEKFTLDMRSECYSMMCRLHYAGFMQGSFYVRNILVQPGPLTAPPEKRSNKTPSFRLIDFGRGEEYNTTIGDRSDKERVDRQESLWGSWIFDEDKRAQRELQIENFQA